MTIQTAFRLDKSLVDKLKKHCADEGRTQTWVANKALKEYLGVSVFVQASALGGRGCGKSLPLDGVKGMAKTSKAAAVVLDDTADKVIDYLNFQAGTRYKCGRPHRKLINARLKEFTKRDMFEVITKKCGEWRGTEMERYLRPSTLFNATKFEEYVNQKVIDKPIASRHPRQQSNLTKHRTIEEQLNDTSWLTVNPIITIDQ